MTVLTAKQLPEPEIGLGGCHLLYMDNHPTYYILTQLDAQVFIKTNAIPLHAAHLTERGN